MATPQLNIISSEAPVSSKSADNKGFHRSDSESGTDFSDSFEQAMADFVEKQSGTQSPVDGTALPGREGELPEGFLNELQQTLDDYFAQLGDLESLSEDELMQAYQDISQRLVGLANGFGLQLNASDIQNALAKLSEGQFTMPVGLQQSGQMPWMLLGQNQLGGQPKEGLVDTGLPQTADTSLLSSLKLLKQSVQSENFANSSVLDGLKSMMASTAATSLSASLDDITNGSQPTVPLQMYNQPQSSAMEEAEVSLQKIPVPPGHRQFTQELSERVMVMSTKNIQTAEIKLSPPELGALMVKINVEGDQASVVFTSPNAGVREALEQQSFRLKDMMEENGVDLVDVDVSDQQKDDSEPQELYSEENSRQQADEPDDTAVMELLENLDKQKSVTASLKLVDYYA